MALLIIYSWLSICNMQAADHVHACTLQKEDLGGKKYVISQYRTCDLMTRSQQLFCHGHANIVTCNSRVHARSPGPTDTSNIQAYEQKFLHQTPYSVGLAQARRNYSANSGGAVKNYGGVVKIPGVWSLSPLQL